jgi:hypothetical protein
MAVQTYVPLATTTLGATSGSVTFSSISQAYKDLVLVMSVKAVDIGAGYCMRFNGDSGANYSFFYFGAQYSTNVRQGNGNSTYQIDMTAGTGASTSYFSTNIAHIGEYSSTNKNKPYVGRWNNQESWQILNSGIWNSTAAITSINIYGNLSATWAAGSTFTLYGIAG